MRDFDAVYEQLMKREKLNCLPYFFQPLDIYILFLGQSCCCFLWTQMRSGIKQKNDHHTSESSVFSSNWENVFSAALLKGFSLLAGVIVLWCVCMEGYLFCFVHVDQVCSLTNMLWNECKRCASWGSLMHTEYTAVFQEYVIFDLVKNNNNKV